MFNNKSLRNYFLPLLLTFIIIPPAAHAYAGPSAAIGVIIIALTVVLAFFSSIIIKTFKLIKYIFKSIFNALSNKKPKQKNKSLEKK